MTLAKYLRKQLSGRENLFHRDRFRVIWPHALGVGTRGREGSLSCVGEEGEGVEERRGEGERSITKI